MSLIIKGMEMPEFPAFREKDNKVVFPAAVVIEKGKVPRLIVNYKIGYVDTNIKSYELLELPTPHGRLIDADKLLRQPMISKYPKSCVRNAPTIIEAEVSE